MSWLSHERVDLCSADNIACSSSSYNQTPNCARLLLLFECWSHVTCAHKTHFDKTNYAVCFRASGHQRSRASVPIIWRRKSSSSLVAFTLNAIYQMRIVISWYCFGSDSSFFLFFLLPRFGLLHSFLGTPNDLHRVFSLRQELSDCDCRNNGHRVYLRSLVLYGNGGGLHVLYNYTRIKFSCLSRGRNQRRQQFLSQSRWERRTNPTDIVVGRIPRVP